MTLAPSATTVTVSVNGTNLDVSVDGVLTSRPLADVGSLSISGGSALSLDLGGGTIPVPVSYVAASAGSVAVGSGSGSTYTYDGHSGLQVAGGGIASLSVQNISSLSAGGTNDTLVGPAPDTTWTISGANSGTVDSLAFSGIENLLGAPNNDDTFVLQQGGSLSGGLDGGAGGDDTLVLDGSWNSVVSDPVNHSSGTLNLDGNVVRYAGLEPITNTGTLSNVTLNLPSASSNSATLTAGGGMLTLAGGTFESTTFAAPTNSLTINFGSQGDTLSIGDISSVYTGALTVNGGAGNDTLEAPDVSGMWDITAVDAGTYTWSGGPTVTFTSVENLTGAPTQNDTFVFEAGGALSGNVVAGGGTLTVGIAGFVQVSGSYDFAQQSYTSTSVTNANVLTVSGTSGTGLVGVNAFSNPLGLQGTLTNFGLAVVTDGTHAWDLFQGTISNPQFVGFGGSLSAGLSNLTVQVDTGSGHTFLNTAATPIVAGSESLAFSTGVIAASTTFSIAISNFVYLAGTFTIGVGLGTTVDVATGLNSVTIAAAAPGLLTLPSVSSCGATLALTADDSTICNLPVNALQISASNISVFVGYASSLTPTGAGGTLQASDVPSDAIGLYASGINVGLVLMSARTTTNAALDALGLKFYSLEATAGNVEIVGIPDVTLSATNIEVDVNSGKGWAAAPTLQAPAVDFAESFGPGGYTIAAGSNPPIVLHAAGHLVGASVDNALLAVGSFVYLSGGLNFSQGPTQYVDVTTGLALNAAARTALFGAITVSDTDPGGTSLAVTSNGSEIWNLPVSTIELGLSNVTVFVGYADNLALDPATSTLDDTALAAANAVGIFLGGGNVGMTLMGAQPVLAAPTLTAAMLKFYALKATVGTVALVGIPDLTLSATNLQVRVNGSTTAAGWPGVALALPPPVVDFVSSFGSGGLAVPTDTSGDAVALDYTGPVLGASADNVFLKVASFVYISGSFSLDAGRVEKVDVATGLTGTAANTQLAGLAPSSSAPTDGSIGRSTDGSMIWNLPVQTIDLGIGNADVFVGYADNLAPTPGSGLTLQNVQNANGVGLLLHGVTLGLVLMRALPVVTAPALTAAQLKFYALEADATTVAIVGIPYVTLTASNVEVRVNQGVTSPGWAGIPLQAPVPVVDFVQSFGSGGFRVPLSTTGTQTVALTYTSPEIGASADQALFQIGNFVYISGSFSFNAGPVLKVDVKTGLTTAEATADGLLAELAHSTTAPANGSLAITPDGSEIWNLSTQSLTVGVASGNIFVGYSTGVARDARGNISQTGLESEGAVGLFMSNVAIGLAMLRAPPIVGAPTLSAAELSFLSLKADAGNVALVGVPDLTISSSNLEVRVNQGVAAGPWPGTVAGNPPPVVDYVASFPSTGGLQIPTDTTGAHPPVTLDYTTPDIGVSSDRVIFGISSFVYVAGGFRFDRGPVNYVDVRTNLPSLEAQALLAGVPVYATDPGGQTLGRTANGSMIWNLPVSTIQVGFHNVNVFVGYSTGLTVDSTTGAITAANGIGLLLQNVEAGLVIMKALPTLEPGIDAGALQFFALDGNAVGASIVGIPDLTLSASNIQVRVNNGESAGSWVAVPVGGSGPPPPPVVDFTSSFGTSGYQVPTDTSGDSVSLAFSSPEIGASADHVVLQVSQYVYISGGFNFDKGPQELVDVDTGLNSITGTPAIGGLPTSATAPTDGSMARTSDNKTIWNLPVSTIQIGLHNVFVFAGYTNTPITIVNGAFTTTDLTNAGAIGVELQNVNLGMVLMNEVAQLVPVSAGTLVAANLNFFALQGTANSLGLVGVPEIQLNAVGASVSVNQGSFTTGPWPALGTTGNPPVVDFVKSFGAGGYQVPTDTSGDSVALTFTSPLVGGAVQQFTIQISSFVYLTGSLAFSKGGALSVPLTSGVVNDATLQALGLNSSIPGLSLNQASVNVTTIGATHVEAFVGVNGPYWNATNPNGIPDRDPITGQIVASEINSSAVGLVIDNLTFGLFLGQPTLPRDPIRYVAMKASASDVAFVGVSGLTATAQNIDVEINMSSPTLEGLPVLPVIDFSGLPGGSYQVPTGALNLDGTPNTVSLDFSTPLIRARSSWIQLDLFGVLDVQGSIAFNLGPQQTVTLSDGSTQTLTTMTVGAAHVSGFVGYNGPYVTDAAGDTNSSAVGLSLDNASVGLFIGVNTATGHAFVAGHLDVPQIHLVNVPSAIVLNGTASVDLNLGVGLLTGGSAINFATTFPVSSSHPTQGFSVDTGDPSHPIVLDFTSFVVNVNVAGTLGLASTFSLAGVFSLQADSSSLKVLGAGTMTLGPDIGSANPLVQITALGVFIVNGQGLAADLDVNASLGIPELGLTVLARLIVNTTGANQTIEIPNRLLTLIQADANNASDPADATLASFLEGRLVTCTDGAHACYTINGAAPAIFNSSSPNLTDVRILLGQTVGTPTYLSSPGSYLVVLMSGTFNFLGFASASGLGALEVTGSSFQLGANLSFTIGPITFTANGFIGIQSDGVQVHIGITVNENLLGLFDTTLSGTLDINTQGSNDYFQLNLSGSLRVLSILSISGSLQVVVDHGSWSVIIPQSNPLSASFGPLSLNAYGDLYSTGRFDLHFNGGITLGDCSSYGCVSGNGFADASFNPSTGMFSFDVGGGLSAEIASVSLFGISASGSVSGTLGQSVTLYLNVSGTGTFIQQVWGVVGSVTNTVCDWLPWPLDSFCHDVTSLIYGWVSEAINKLTSFSLPVATFSLPGALTNVVAPPNLASQSGGALTLNVGSRASSRNVSQSQTNETYEISSAGPGAVKITAFGTNQTFTGVSSITGNFGGGADELILDPGMVLPVSVGGAGNATVVGYGTSLIGLPGTGGGSSLVIVDGGPNPLTVNGQSTSAALYLTNLGGGTGTLSSTQLTGFHTSGIAYSGFGGLNLMLSPGNDTLNVVSAAANTTTTINAGQGSATINVSNAGLLNGITGQLVVNGIGGENDVLNVSDVADTAGRTGTLTASALTGLGTAGITYSNMIQLNLTLGSGHNTFSVGSTAGQTLTTISTAAGSASGTIDVGNDLTQIQGPLTVNGGGADSLVVSDSAASGSLHGSLTSSTLSGLGMGSQAEIDYGNLAGLTITLGGSGNTFSILSTASGITTTVTAGVGNNTVVVQGTSGTTVVNAGTGNVANTVAVSATGDILTPIQGALTISGRGTDTLQVDDRGETSVRNGTLTSSTLAGLGLGAGGIGYSGIGFLTLVLGSGNDTFAVNSTIGGSTTLALGGGSDTIDLSGLNGTVVLNGGNGNNTITVHSTNLGSTLTVNEGTGSNWVAILAANGTVIVNEGSGTDVLELGSNAAATPRGVDTGGNVNAIAGGVSVNGGAGTDSLYLDETGDSSSTGNDGTLTAGTISGLGLGAGISYNAQELVSLALGAGSTEFAVQSTSTQTVLNTGAGNDTVDVSSDGRTDLGNLAGLHGLLTIDGQGGSDTLIISDLSDALAGTGRLSSTSFTGFGTAGIDYAGFEAVNVQLGQAVDQLEIVSTYLQAVTTIRAGPGSDTINVSSDAPTDLGTLSGIAGHLIVEGQTGTGDVLNVSDAGDAVGQTGALTATGISGLGTAGIDYAGIEQLHITLGSGADTFSIASTGASTTLATGAGNDTVLVGAPTGLLNGIDNPLSIDGGAGTDYLLATDANDPTGQTGTLTSNFISGLSTTNGVGYTGFEQVEIDLGLGADTFTILSTITGPTTVNGGPGNDSIDVETIAGPTVVNGQAGNDTLTVNGDTTNPSTSNGIGALLTLDGGDGSDAYIVNTFGNGDSTIDVFDSGLTGLNMLTINGTAAADVFLFRAGLVASLTGFTGGAYTHAERINYTSAITGGLTVNGLAGDDTFALDDNSAVTTVNGGDGNDTFQVGQLFGTPELFVTAVDLTSTTRGDLSNGISFATTLNGDGGADTFSIFHNMAPLTTNGGDGNDTFLVRTFVALDRQTTVSGDGGADLIQYVQNAPVVIDGGDGTDTVVVFGTEADDTFTVTATSVTGSGISISLTNIEIVRIDGLEGNDTFTIRSTAPGVSTFIYGGLGSDTFNIGPDVSQIQGPLTVSGGDDPAAPPAFPAPILLPGEATSVLPVLSNPNLAMIESHQVDTLDVNDTAVSSGATGTLTSSTVSGLGMDAAGIVYANIEAVNVELGPGADTLAIDSTIAGTTVVDTGAGNDAVRVTSIAGPTAVEGGAGDDTITVSNAVRTLAGIGSLLAVDGGPGTNTLVVDDSGVTADTLGTLTQTSLTGLDMVGTGSVQLYSLTVGAATTSFTVTLSGFGSETFAAGTTGAQLQAALQQLMFPGATCGLLGASRCAQSVFVWQFGGDYLVGFEGEVAAAPPVLTAAAPGTTATVLPRTDGLNYYDIADLSIGLGSGNDRFNVRGTSASTSLNTGAGDDVAYVSDSANLGLLPSAAAAETGDLAALQSQVLYGTLTTGDLTFHGTLDEIRGELAIDEGTGSNTLAISDRGDTAPRTAIFTGTSIVGLAPAPISYGATGGDLGGEGYWTLQSDSGLFGHGIQVYGGSGGNTFTVTGTYASDLTPSPFGETLTSLFTGEGNDVVHVAVPAGPARALVVDGQSGNDSIDGTGSTLPLVLFGNAGDDAVTSGVGNDILFGDTGRVVYLRPAGARGYDVVLGGVELAAYQSAPVSADGDFLTPDAIYTDGLGADGVDTITAANGNDIVFGGPDADTITGGNGNDIVFGDDGRVVPGAGIVETQDPGVGAADTITTGNGNDVVFGGAGGDAITTGSGNDVVFGDDGRVAPQLYETQDPSVAGADTIVTGDGNDVVFGGPGADRITTGNGNDTVFGDDGRADLAAGVSQTQDPGVGSADMITTGNGNDVVFGGAGGDAITVGNGDDVVFGDDGRVAPQLYETQDPSVAGADTIVTGDGNDVVFGGPGADRITTGNGADVVFGDDGSVDLAAGVSQTQDPGVGDADTITTGNGNDVVFGGAAGDTITVGNGTDTVFGDDGRVTPLLAQTEDDAIGGNDTITSGTGNDVVFGGAGSDTITDTGGHNVVLGDSGYAQWGASELTAIVPTDPTLGAADTITITGAGSNYVIGGAGGDTITTGPSDDLIFGDFGQITGDIPLTLPVPTGPATFAYTSIYTQNAFGGGNDVIHAGDGRNIVIGGQGNDTIIGGNGDDDLIGGNNVPGAQDGSDTIDGGGGDDVICGDNCSILPNGLATNPIDRTLTAPTIYSPVTNPDGSVTYLPNVAGPALDPTGSLERTVTLFDGGTIDPTLYGNDYLAGGAGNDEIFGQMGNDVIQGDGSVTLDVGTFDHPGVSVADFAGPGTDGNDYVEGGGGNDLIFGDQGQDVLIGGSSDLFGYTTPAQRPDGVDKIFGGAGTEIGLDDPGDSGVNAHSHDADVMLGDNGDAFRLMSSSGRYLTDNYDNYPGETEHIIPAAVELLDYSPTGDASYVSCLPSDPSNCQTVFNATPTNIGGADFLHGEGGNDVIYGETGDDTIFGDGQDDQLYGNSGNDWMSGGTGDDGMLGDDGLLLASRGGIAEPLNGIAATTQLILGTDDGENGNLSAVVNVTGALNYTAIEQPFWVGGNDIMYGGLGNDFMHGGQGNDAMSGAEALPLYYDNGVDPLSVIARYYDPNNVLGYDPSTQTFSWFDPTHPFEKIMVAPGVDFLLNFVSATNFGATTNQGIVDDGKDALFGDGGNDWLVGGTNTNYLFGGFGNDILNADNNLDSTRVDVPVTYSSLCALVGSYSSDRDTTGELCGDLAEIQQSAGSVHGPGADEQIGQWVEEVTRQIGDAFTPDEAATLIRLAQALEPDYSPLANDTVDPVGGAPGDLSEADIAFGGPGRDILIANTASDRLIDWNESANTYYVPWEGHDGHPVITRDPSEDVVQFLYDLSLGLGADPTRPEIASPPSTDGEDGAPAYQNGEPFGELGLVLPPDEGDGDGGWPQRVNPGLDVEGAPDVGSLGVSLPLTPSAHLSRIEEGDDEDGHVSVDDTAESLLHHIVVRGQLTAVEVAGLTSGEAVALQELVGAGLVQLVDGVYVPTDSTWLRLGLADAPHVTRSHPWSVTAASAGVTLSGTGDAGDTITVSDGALVLGTTTVLADGTWQLTAFPEVGRRTLTATQTVNELPHAGLTSAASKATLATVLPDAPTIAFVSTPAAAAPAAAVTIAGTGIAGYRVTIFDGERTIASGTIAADGTWSFVVLLGAGTHSLAATQTAPGNFTSASSSVGLTVYAPTPQPYALAAPANVIAGSPFTLRGAGVPGETISVYDGSAQVGTTTVLSNGTWSLTVSLSATGSHALTAVQLNPASGFWSTAAGFTVTAYAQPAPPTISGATMTAKKKWTVGGTGANGETITLYDGARAIATVVVSGGTWSAIVALGDGTHTLTATQTVVPAVTSVPSSSVVVTVQHA